MLEKKLAKSLAIEEKLKIQKLNNYEINVNQKLKLHHWLIINHHILAKTLILLRLFKCIIQKQKYFLLILT